MSSNGTLSTELGGPNEMLLTSNENSKDLKKDDTKDVEDTTEKQKEIEKEERVVLIDDSKIQLTNHSVDESVGNVASNKLTTFDGEIVSDDMLTDMKLKQNNLFDEILKFRMTVKPTEFESYNEFFTLHKFKKGTSASGQVNFEMLRRREHGIYYKKIKMDTQTQGNREETQSSTTIPALLEDDSSDVTKKHDPDKLHKDEEFNESKSTTPEDIVALLPRVTRSKNSQTSVAAIPYTTTSSIVTSNKEKKSTNPSTIDESKKLINGDISTQSIIPNKFSDSTRRRSSRISKRTSDRTAYNNSSNDNSEIEDSSPHIEILFESIIPKVLDPIRRSDWILQPRERFTSEKQLHTHPQYKVVKMNELVSENRIQTILSRFEGGVAGLRKRGT